VPQSVKELLNRAGTSLEEIDLFVFHQANQYMLEHLRKKLKIPKEKFYIAMAHCGNTVSATIPIALKHALEKGIVQPGHQVMLVGFGVGYSWGSTLIRWAE
jgi:3-oxoacyl-[acyl-carrier-protein] synthase-3